MITANLSPGLQREFISAIERTGWTPQLYKAAQILPVILKMTPEEFEKYSAPIYQRTA